MTPATPPQTKPHPRRDGWTPPRRQAFLDALGAGLDVRQACARAGLSRRSAYNLRARDAAFAPAWGEAQRAALADEERRFRELVAERLPWARSVLSGACRPGEGDKGAGTPSHLSRPCELRRAADPAPALRRDAARPRCRA